MMRHMGRGPWSRAEVEEGMERWLAHWAEHGFGVWVAEDRETGEPVGRAGLSWHRAWPADPEAGWWIAPAWQSRGLATEAGRAAVEFGLGTLGFPRLVSICIEANVASRRVMEKLGFEKLVEVDDPRGLRLWVHALSARSWGQTPQQECHESSTEPWRKAGLQSARHTSVTFPAHPRDGV